MCSSSRIQGGKVHERIPIRRYRIFQSHSTNVEEGVMREKGKEREMSEKIASQARAGGSRENGKNIKEIPPSPWRR